MLRKLIALLLLLTGLAALAQPAQARGFEGDCPRSAAASDYASVPQARALAASRPEASAAAWTRLSPSGTGEILALPFVTVRLQADRARE